VWAGSCEQTLMMTGNQVSMMVITLVTSLLMVAGGIWSVQHYGATGVAATSAAGLIFQNAVMLLVVRKKLGIWTHVFLTKGSRAGTRP